MYYRFNKKKRAEQAERFFSNPDLFTTLQIFDFMERPVMRSINKLSLPKVHLNHKIYVPKLDSHGLFAPGKRSLDQTNMDACCALFLSGESAIEYRPLTIEQLEKISEAFLKHKDDPSQPLVKAECSISPLRFLLTRLSGSPRR